MAKLIEITGKVLSGEWGTDDESGNGVPVLRTTNFTNEGIVDYSNVVTRTIQKKNIDAKYLRKGDIIIEKSGGSDKQPVGRVIYFDGQKAHTCSIISQVCCGSKSSCLASKICILFSFP